MSATRLHIALVVDRFGSRFGGAEAYGVALMRELAPEHDITVFAREFDPACPLHLPFVRVPVSARWPSWVRSLLFAWRAARATRTGFDIVHSHKTGWCGDIEVVHVTPVRYRWRVQAISRIQRWLSYISPRVQTYLGLESRRLAPRPGHRTVAVSALIADQLSQAYGSALPVTIIPPGVTLPDRSTPSRRHEIRERLGLTEDEYVCLLVARNPMRKGLPTVIKALESLPQSVRVLVVGANAASREHVAQAPQSLRDRVCLVNETSDVDGYYQAADAYIHPTLNDSFGMAPLEAMSYGLPVILSPMPWCGFAQYVRDGDDALLLSHPENAAELARYIEQLRTDPSLRAKLVTQAQRLLDQHAWPQVARQYLALYQAVLAERQSITD
ncbi:glycosyltransferase family 4 protein [Alcaligenaceae bacterium CGII-47]|nr:glycosyltransferase family 4 protein [Alcaligenaceae bacterium CGII-47]